MDLSSPQMPRATQDRRPKSTCLLVMCVLLGTVAVVAWLAPVAKTNAVFGRYSYGQFWLVLLSTSAALSAFAIAALPATRRRGLGFRLGALWVGMLAGLSLTELSALLLPVKNQMDNPWYFCAGGGVAESEELPFGRPPHLKWEGLSRGDLAIMGGDEDPHARQITFETDWQGFRNGEDLEQADLIVIGDSFSEAGNLPEVESFCSLIGRELEVTSRNLGRAGYGAPSELVVLKKYGLACQPKIVVWQIAESNDLDDALRYSKWTAAGRPRFFDLAADRRWQRSKAWQQRSPTFRVFELVRHHDPRPWPTDGWFEDATGKKNRVRFMNLTPFDVPVRHHAGWAAQAQALRTGALLCRSNDIQLVMLLVPTKYRVLGPHTRMLDPSLPQPSVASRTAKTNSLRYLLRSLCESVDVTFADATRRLEERAGAGELVYLPYDTHLSPAGHEVVAGLVVEKLQSGLESPPVASESKL